MQVGSKTKFRAAIDAVKVLSTEHRKYLAKEAVQPAPPPQEPGLPHQGSGDKVCLHV